MSLITFSFYLFISAARKREWASALKAGATGGDKQNACVEAKRTLAFEKQQLAKFKKKQQFLEKLWLTPNSRMPAPNGQICLFVNCMFCVKVFKIGKVNTKFFNEYLKKRNGS